MRRDFVNAEVEAEAQAAPPAPPAAWPAYPAPRRAAESVIHQKAKQGELLWVKAALDAGADIGDREGPVRGAFVAPSALHARRMACAHNATLQRCAPPRAPRLPARDAYTRRSRLACPLTAAVRS